MNFTRDSLEFVLPDGRKAIASEMTVDSINKLMSKGKVWDNISKIINANIRIVEDDGTTSKYSAESEYHVNNFSCIMALREVTLGKCFEFQVKSSNPNSDFGKVGKKQFAAVWLGDTYIDPQTIDTDNEIELPNPHAIKPIKFAENIEETDGNKKIGVDQETGRMLIYLPKSNITVVAKILKGRGEQNFLSDIPKKFSNSQASISFAMKVVGILGKEAKDSVDDFWTLAKFERVDEEFFKNIGWKDLEHFNNMYGKLTGGLELSIESVQYIVRVEEDDDGEIKIYYDLIEDETLVTVDDQNQIPFYGKDFFSTGTRNMI